MAENVMRLLDRIPAVYAANDSLMRRARRARLTFLLEADQVGRLVTLDCGRLAIRAVSGPMDGWDFALRAKSEAWMDHWKEMPSPDASDILGMARYGRMRIEGNFLPLMQHLQIVKDIVALPRCAA
ncbi:hypothetical protein [Hoeflea olei]|uniref:SCP2 domain-containing protein n=1 Tax=Hoeflea olei TaxID=1480615 RepID=A0A1C1Z1I0_9HYPH|nr:hypothetical protein [Hoeflea olei]OCW59595.1 hypothetical protein AWJ14_11360 [Hoeflea olei]